MVAVGILVMVDLPVVAAVAAEQAELLQRQLDGTGLWIPTTLLAIHAAERLRADGSRQVDHPQGVIPVPGVEITDRTWHMRNWYGPIADWYSSNRITPGLTRIAPGADSLCVEVGIMNYELAEQGLLLQVMVRVTDMANGTVLARDRQWSLTPLPEHFDPFSDGGAPLKLLISSVGEHLLDDAITQTGLLAKQR